MADLDERAAAARHAMGQQARACARLGSPFMARLMGLLAERLAPGGDVANAMLGWQGDPGPAADNPSMRLAGALHALVLEGADAGLGAVYPPHDVPDDDLWAAIDGALVRHDTRILSWLARAPQTNEIRRAAALIPAFAMVARATGRPLALWEVGCSAGLNLRADLFGLQAARVTFGPEGATPRLVPDWSGPTPEPVPLEVVERRGVDISPLDPTTPDGRLRLLSYLWADQPERRALTEAAIALAARMPARIETGDAVAWLSRTLPERCAGVATIIYHSIAWQYLPRPAQAEGRALIAAAGAEASSHTPLAHVAMEADGGRLAGLSLTLWPGGTRHSLARVDFHGRSVEWEGPTTFAPLDTRA